MGWFGKGKNEGPQSQAKSGGTTLEADAANGIESQDEVAMSSGQQPTTADAGANHADDTLALGDSLPHEPAGSQAVRSAHVQATGQKKSLFSRIFGLGKHKVAAQDDAGDENLQQVERVQEEEAAHDQPQHQRQGELREEFSNLEPVAQETLDDADIKTLLSNNVLGVIDVIHEEPKPNADRAKSSDEDDIAKKEITWEQFQQQRQLDRKDQELQRVLAKIRWWIKKSCLCCNPIISRVEKWMEPNEELPEYPERNLWCQTQSNPFRKFCMRLANSSTVELLWLCNNIIHAGFSLLAEVPIIANADPQLISFISFGCVAVYQAEFWLKSTAWGFSGGKKSLWNSDLLNRVQVLLALAALMEYAGASLSLAGFGLLRLFRYFMQIETFAAINMFLLTAEKGVLPLSTVVGVILLCLVFFGVIGMAGFRSSLRRRCVWADTMELKVPEQFCKRYQTADEFVSVINNCGPLQLCIDMMNPNNGFTSFDNMPASLLSLFQALSTDAQYNILWACLQSEPDHPVIVAIYFLCLGILIGQVLINVFVAVVANVLGYFRALYEEQLEHHHAKLEAELKNQVSDGNMRDSSFKMGHQDSMKSLPKVSMDAHEDEKDAVGEASSEETVHLLQDHVITMTDAASFVFRSGVYRAMAMLAIFLNCISLALIGSFDPIGGFSSEDIDNLLGDINAYFSLFFLVDWMLQVLCEGSFGKYFSDGKHIYDFVVNVPTTFAIVGQAFGASRDSTAVLRSMGILRIMRGCEFFFLRPIWLMLLEAVRSASLVLNLVVVLIFFIIGYFCLGERMFQDAGLDSRSNFDSFSVGFITLFQIMTGDSWSGLMYSGMNTACDEVEGTCSTTAALAYSSFYIIFFFFGQYVFVTLFLALILENFQVTNFMTIGETDADAALVREEAYAVVGKLQWLPAEAVDFDLVEKAFFLYADFPSSIHAVISRKKLIAFISSKQPKILWKLSKLTGYVYLRYLIRFYCLPKRCRTLILPYPGDKDWIAPPRKGGHVEDTDGDAEEVVAVVKDVGIAKESKKAQREARMKKEWKPPIFLRHSFYVNMTNSTTFSTLVYFAITLSSLLLAFETPAEQVKEDDHPYLEKGYFSRFILRSVAPFLFTSIFALEAVIKIVALGFFFPYDINCHAYMQDGWNRVDFTVLLMSVFDLTGAGDLLGSNFTSVVKISRAFRPILLLRKNREMKNVVVAFLGSVKPIGYAMLFLLLVTIMFSTMGMALFKDRFYYCSDDTLDGLIGEGKSECYGNFMVDDIYFPRVWDKPPQNFDTFGSSCVTLLKCLTLKWVAVLQIASDAHAKDVQPVLLINKNVAIIYFLGLIVTGSFISLNFFVSFVVDGFYAAQGQGEENQNQEIYYEWIQHKMILHWPGEDQDDPDTKEAKMCRSVVNSMWFKWFSSTCVVTNVVLICLSHEGESESFQALQAYQNNVFFGIMVFEVVLKFVAQGIHNFWRDAFNRFDCVLIVVTVICMLSAQTLRTIAQVVRSCRLARFMRTLLKNKLIEGMLDTVVLSIRQVLPVLLVLALGMSIFSVIGVAFFGTVKFGIRLGPQANFQTFTAALMTCFQILFGDEWQDLVEDTAILPPYCTANFIALDGRVLSYGDCGIGYTSFIYFLGYKVVCEFTILNLFVGMILNNFSFCAGEGDSKSIITEHHIEHFARIWVKEADRKKTGTIPMDFIYKLMFRIGAPLGMYGNKQNIGRFLCVREHVRREVERLDDQKQQGYAFRAFRYLVQVEMLHFEKARLEWINMHKKAKEYERDLKERDLSMQRASYEDSSEEDESDEAQSVGENGADESEGEENGGQDAVSGTNFGHYEPLEEEARGIRRRGHASCRNPAELKSNDEVLPTVVPGQVESIRGKHSKGGGRGRSSRIMVWMSGESMGYGGAPRKKGPPTKVKRVKKEQKVYAMDAAKVRERREQEAQKQMDEWIAEDRAKKAFIQEVHDAKAPQVTWVMKVAGALRWTVEGMVSKRVCVLAKRLPGYACFDDVFNALIYWNNKDDIIPQYLLDKRRIEDDEVITTVANQIIEGLVRGAIFRRQQRRLRENIRIQKLAMQSKSFISRFRSRKAIEKVEAEELAKLGGRPKTQIERPNTPVLNEADIIIYNEGEDTDTERGILAILIRTLKVDSHKLAKKAMGWGFKLGPEEIMGIPDRGVRLLLEQPEVEEHVKELKARRDVTSLSVNEAMLLRMAADMNGIDLTDVEDLAQLSCDHLYTILNESTVKKKLDAMKIEVEKQKQIEAERALNPKTPQEVVELRRVKRQKERLEQLNKQIRDEREELKTQLAEAKKQTDMLSKEWAHARREAAHFASETMNAKTMLEHIRAAQRLPEPLEMSNASRTDEKQDGTALNADKQTKRAENSRQDVNDDLDGTPEEVSKRLTDKIAIQKDLLARLEQQLAKFKSGDPAAGRRLPSSWAYRGDVEAMKAIRKQKIAEAMKQREERIHGSKHGPSSGVLKALGLQQGGKGSNQDELGRAGHFRGQTKAKPSWL